MSQRWRQIRGDPSIRRFLFRQSRVDNEFDNDLSGVLAKATRLLVERGMFHAKLHFSSGQVTLWSMHEPYNYQVYLKDEFLRSGFEASFPGATYPINAVVPPNRIDDVMAVFKSLRRSDKAVYLRSGSLNIINGIVGLNFSCDGSHYLHYMALLEQGADIIG